jgi:flagellar protein FlgJ
MTSPLLPAAQSPAATTAANTYTDLAGLAAIKKDPNSPQAMHALAQQVDALFLQMMLKSMREAGAEEGEPDSNAMGMYQDLYDKQISLTLSQHGGLGIGALLTRQMAAAAAGGASTGPVGSTPATAPTAMPLRRPPTAAVGDAEGEPGAVTQESASEFVNAVMPTIRAAAGALGVDPVGMLAQAVLETGWGKRMARTADGAASLNMFGIKADEHWGGARATANTLEFSGGVATQRQTAFRAYGSIAESVNDFAGLLRRSPRYAEAVTVGGDAQAYVKSIGTAGYATDPEYANKLNGILNSSTFKAALGGSNAL